MIDDILTDHIWLPDKKDLPINIVYSGWAYYHIYIILNPTIKIQLDIFRSASVLLVPNEDASALYNMYCSCVRNTLKG